MVTKCITHPPFTSSSLYSTAEISSTLALSSITSSQTCYLTWAEAILFGTRVDTSLQTKYEVQLGAENGIPGVHSDQPKGGPGEGDDTVAQVIGV